MNNLIRKIIFVSVILDGSYLFAQMNSISFQYDFNVLQIYQERNKEFIFDYFDSNNYSSRIEGNLRFSAGDFGQTQFETELRYTSFFSKPENSSMSIRQMYAEVPLTDFSFLTVGKKRKNFGEAIFHSFSNRFSPTEIFIDRSERIIPALVEFSWIVSPIISLETTMWFNEVENWNDVNLSQGIEITLDRFYGDAHLYYENQKRWLSGLNLSYNFNITGFYFESIIKENSDQFVVKKDSLVKREGLYYSSSLGMSRQWDDYSIRIEYAYRSEGYSNSEKENYKEYTNTNNDSFQYYSLNYYDKRYLSLSLSAYNFIKNNISVRISNIFASNFKNGYVSAGIGYYYRDTVVFGIYDRYYYGNNNSEYILFSPMKQYIFTSISVSF